MILSERGLQEFCEAYERTYGRSIAPDAAREMASRLLTLFEVLARRDSPALENHAAP